MACPVAGNAQRSTSSPYSIYGVGELVAFTNAGNGAMGGLSQGFSSKDILSFRNPATLGSISRHYPMINVGLESNLLYVPSRDSIRRHGYFRNFEMGMRLNDRWSSGFGMRPYSFTGYFVQENETLGDGSMGLSTNTGSGGLSAVFWSNAINLIPAERYSKMVAKQRTDSTGKLLGVDSVNVQVIRQLSVGFTGSYIFGSTYHTSRYTLPQDLNLLGSKVSYTDHWRGWKLETGLFGMIVNEQGLILQGGITANPTGLLKRDQWSSAIRMVTVNGYDSPIDTVSQDTSLNVMESLPWGGGAGFTIGKQWDNGESLMVGVEFDYEAWTLANVDGYLQDRVVWRAGLQWGTYLTSQQAQPWLFRVGGKFDNGYIVLDGQKVQETGMTFGLGIPFKERGRLTRTNSRVNIGAEVGRRGDASLNQVKENYSRIFIGFTLKPAAVDGWFKKRRYD